MDNAPAFLQQLVTQRSLRIAMVSETYPPEINGVAMTMGRIVEGLRRRRHSIQLIRPRQHRHDQPARQPGFDELLVHGVPIPRYDCLKVGLPARRTLRRAWTEHRPDIVHVVTEGPLGWSAIAAAREMDLPVCTDFHTNFHTYTQHYGAAWLKEPIMGYLRRFHNRTLATLVPTQSIRDELEQLGLDNLHVVARGVDTSLFSPRRRSAALRESWGADADTTVVTYVGRISPEKNLPLVLRAFDAMRHQYSRLRLVLVGDGPSRAALQAMHPEHEFAGIRRDEDLATHYASADVFLFPSTTETYGNVTIEAMASGLAVIAYDYASAAQHIRHGTSGLLAGYNNAAEFTRLAVSLANDRGRVRHLGAHARAVSEKLDWEWIVAEFELILLQFAASGARHEPAPGAAA